MFQIIQNLRTGSTTLEEVPSPVVKFGNLLIKTRLSLVSLGTEKMLVEFGRSNLISKAKQQPEKVRQVLDKIKSEGLLPTMQAVFNKLDQPLPLGYCNVGEIIEIGEGVSGYKVGYRVVSNGQHAEYVCIPKNLVAKIPDNVSDEDASFTVVGSIGLHGVRLLNPTLGETVVVIGLGLIGLITAQILKANGCYVIGFDYDMNKINIAKSWGIDAINPSTEDAIKYVDIITNFIGADAIIITASNNSDEVISQAAKMCRKRGRIVLVGVIGLKLNRSEFYEKEISFQVSCSYGPGRYDDNYEQNGNDYPLPYVRWTEKRNFEAILDLISRNLLKMENMITEQVSLNDYHLIYNTIGKSKSIASIIRYPQNSDSKPSHSVVIHENVFSNTKGLIAVIGAGNFTKMTLLPILKSINANIKYISSANGVSGTALAKKYRISESTTTNQKIWNDNQVDLVVITTQHNHHATQVIQSLEAGKHVFVQKPLALHLDELSQISEAYNRSNKTLTVGFNRRFSPHSVAIKNAIGNTPINIIATMYAGFIPSNSWVHDLKIG